MNINIYFKITLFIVVIFVQNLIFAQVPTVQSAIPVYSNAFDSGMDVITDSQDNVYSAFEFRATSETGPQHLFHIGNLVTLPFPSSTPNTLPSSGYYISDAILMKQNAQGVVQWTLRSQGGEKETVRTIAVDPSLNVIYGGEIMGPNSQFLGGTYNFNSTDGTHGLLAKVDSNGNLLWEKTFLSDISNFPGYTPSSPSGAKVYNVVTDSVGNIYALIYFAANSITIGSTTFTNPLIYATGDSVLAKFDTNGNVMWAKQIRSISDDAPADIIMTVQNELVIVGSSAAPSSLSYDGNVITASNINSYIIKINPSNGEITWNRFIEGLFFTSLAADNIGNLYVGSEVDPGTYSFAGLPIENNSSYVGSRQIILLKYNNVGNEIWSRKAAYSAGHNYSTTTDRMKDVKVKADSNIIISGYFRQPDLDFGNGVIINNNDEIFITGTSTPSSDIYIAEYTPQGNIVRARSLGSTLTTNETINRIALKSDQTLFAVGGYKGITQLDTFPISGGNWTASDAFLFSTTSWANIGGNDTTPPTAPTNLAVTNITAYSVGLSWTASTDNVGVSSYDTYVNGVYHSTVTGTATTATISGLSPSTNYSFYVVAKDIAVNQSQPSNTVTATTLFDPQYGTDLYISEYIEGTDDNKAIEITNPTPNPIDMSNYSIRQQVNGSGGWIGNYQLSGIINPDEAYVIVHSDANFSCMFMPDFDALSPMDFDGNDPIGLFKNSNLLDIVGNFDSSAVFGQDVSLWRNVYNPSTTYNPTQWVVQPVNYCSDLLMANPERNSLGTTEIPKSKKIKIFPNPVSDILFIEEIVSNGKIYSVDGKLVKKTINGKLVLVHDLPAGAYILVGETKDKINFNAKFLKK